MPISYVEGNQQAQQLSGNVSAPAQSGITYLPEDQAVYPIQDRVALTEALARSKEPQAGKLPQESLLQSIIGAISQGGLQGITAGGGKAVASRGFDIPLNEPGSPKYTSPYVYGLSEAIGQLLPIGRIASAGTGAVRTGAQIVGAAPSALSTILKSGAAGALYGGASGALEKAAEPGATTGESLQAAIVPAVVGGAIGTAIPAAIPAAKATFSFFKGFGPKQAEDVLSNVAKFNERGDIQTRRSLNGDYGKLLPEIIHYSGERTFDLSPTEQFVQGARTAIAQRKSIYAPILTQGNPQVIVKYFTEYPQKAEAYVIQQLQKGNKYTDKEIQNVLPYIRDQIGEINNSNIIDKTSGINSRISSIYDKPGSPTLHPNEKEALQYLRDFNSNKVIKPILKDNNVNPDIYTDAGKIGDIVDSLGEEYLQASGKEQAARGATFGETIAEPLLEGKGIQASGANLIKKSTQGVLKGRQGYIDRQMGTIFDKVNPEAPNFSQRYPYFPPPGVPAGPPSLTNPPQVPISAPIAQSPSIATPTTAPGQFNAPKASVTSTLPADVQAAIEQTNPVPTGVLDEDIKAALKQLGVKPSDPKYRTLGAALKRQGQIIPQNPNETISVPPGEIVPPNVPSSVSEPAPQTPSTPASIIPKDIPAPLEIKSYPKDIQDKLDAAHTKYQDMVDFYKRNTNDQDLLGKRLKGAGMKFAAEKRQITGELTGKEEQAVAKRLASNFIGKDVSVNIGGEVQSAKVIGNPFGRVKIKLSNGKEMTVSPKNLLTRSVESSDLPNPENVNQTQWYHGSSSKNLTPETIDPVGKGKSNSLFGLGFYVTDDASIAKSYQIGKSKGVGNIYKVNTENIKNIINFDKPLDPKVLKILQESVYSEYEPIILQASKKPNATGSTIWKELTDSIQEDSHADMIPASEFEEMFQNIQGNLRSAGYDAITHVGGVRIGKGNKTHKVLILLDPNNFSGTVGENLPNTIKSIEKFNNP